MRFVLLLLISCSSNSIKDRYNNVSNSSLGDLARTSYHKGCVDIIKRKKLKTKTSYLECRELSKKHSKSILEILNQGPLNQAGLED